MALAVPIFSEGFGTVHVVRKSSATIGDTDFGVLSMRQKRIGCAKSAVY